MKKKAKEILTNMKCEIADSMTEGCLSSILAELASDLSRDDLQQIECDQRNHGVNWATDSLVDRLRTRDDNAFVKFVQALGTLPQTKDLYKKIKTECIKSGLNFSFHEGGGNNRPRPSRHKVSGNSDKRSIACNILISLKPTIRENLSPGDLSDVLRNLEIELTNDDAQEIKSLSKHNGSRRAVDALVDCIVSGTKKAYMIFVKYMHDNNNMKDVYLEIEKELIENGLQALLPKLPVEQSNGKGSSIKPPKFQVSPENQSLVKNLDQQLVIAQQCTEEPEPTKSGKSTGDLWKSTDQDVLKDLERSNDLITPGTSQQRKTEEGSKNLERRNAPESAELLEQVTKKAPPEDQGKVSFGENLKTERTPVVIKTEKYKMSSTPRGMCLVLSNKDFSATRVPGGANLLDRIGTDVDISNLKQVFDWLGFDVKIHENVTAMKLWNSLLRCKNEDHSSFDCLVICILTHGLRRNNSDIIYGIDGETIPLDSIFSLFNGESCPSLVEKPKLFFLQCCRGILEDLRNVTVDLNEHDGPADSKSYQNSAPIQSDFFIGYATPPGYKSWRNVEKGSWYISKLCEVFGDMARDYDLLTMITKVNNEVSKFYTENQCKQVPNPSMTLRKQLFFVPVDGEVDDTKSK